MGFDKKEILALAELAKLNLSEAELVSYSQQLEDILAYVDKIKNIKLDKLAGSVAGLESAELTLRADQSVAGDPTVFAQTKLLDQGYLSAPNVFKK